MIVAFSFNHQLSRVIIDYHELSSSLSLLKFFMIVDDSFFCLATRTISKNRVLLSKARSRDRFPEADVHNKYYMKFEHQISEETYQT